MTDLERARRMLRDWGDEADVVIADELAAARREGAEAEAMKWRAERHTWEKAELEAFVSGRKAGKHEAALEDKYGSFDAKVQAQIADAERRGAEGMRERAAQTAMDHEAPTTARAILHLPLMPEER